ncbi:restriction endonuclease subunit S [Congregibacter litoralis]|uniref:Restriction endonuclease S subunit n=1 Tax=Congregibacter litoralis KT71 TaxID=314285 RepID=A4AEB7_9GAMM|nr:restriction endonuclease subunit S [Congregibacter litoralis]EAQ95652.1 Restriction endonuclease S subunit [Congregibacter litoralis KT71]
MLETFEQTQLFRFDQMAVQVKEKVDPAEADVDRYVGLEHIDPESLKIRRWGETSEVESSKILFKSGDIIFGKRRAYQRKLCVADFDGICSAHAMVLRPKTDVVLEDFLPFFMQSEIFMNRAVKISVGGLSPTINWRDLAKEEFALPPLQEQRRIVQLLSAAERYQNALYDLSERGTSSRDSLVDHRMRGATLGATTYHERVGRYFNGWNLVPLGELLTAAQYGLSESLHGKGQYPILRMMNLEDGKATADDLKYLDLSDSDFETYRLVSGDVLFNRTNSYELVGRTGVYDLPGDFVFASYLIRLKTDIDRLSPEYLSAFLRAPIGRRQVMSFATRGVSQANINASNLKRVLVPLPPIGYQKEVVELLTVADSSRRWAIARLQVARELAGQVVYGSLAR